MSFHQMSPTVKPSGNGSSASTTYWAMPVIHARPVIVGTTARYGPTVVASISRPVKMVLSRKESLRVHPKRHATIITMKTGAKRDGTLTALQVRVALAGLDLHHSCEVDGDDRHREPRQAPWRR